MYIIPLIIGLVFGLGLHVARVHAQHAHDKKVAECVSRTAPSPEALDCLDGGPNGPIKSH